MKAAGKPVSEDAKGCGAALIFASLLIVLYLVALGTAAPQPPPNMMDDGGFLALLILFGPFAVLWLICGMHLRRYGRWW